MCIAPTSPKRPPSGARSTRCCRERRARAGVLPSVAARLGLARPTRRARPRWSLPSSVKAVDEAPVLEERVVLQAEHPRHGGELGLADLERAGCGCRRRSRRRPSTVAAAPRPRRDGVEVVPAGPVAREPQLAGGAPERLQDRLVRAAGHEPLAGDGAVAGELRRPQLRAVPRHARVVPAEPRQAPPVRADARGGVEVVAGGHVPAARPARRLARRPAGSPGR